MYCYAHPHPAVTVDCVIFQPEDDAFQVLLIQRRHDPFAGAWALPGGFVDIDEPLAAAAARELAEETGLDGIDLHQVAAYGDVGRDPRERVISIAWCGLLPFRRQAVQAGDDAAAVRWFPVRHLPLLAFDHHRIIADALALVLHGRPPLLRSRAAESG